VTTTIERVRTGGGVTVEPRISRTRKPVEVLAALGVLALAVEAFILGKWLLGPEFKAVASGPSVPPTWMKIVMNVVQVGGIMAAAFFLYWFLVRPWRRERRVTFDGLFCLASLTSSYQDPLSDYFGHWFTYNSYLFNKGSWVGEIPGWSFAKPGATVAYPLLVVPPAYIWVFLGLMILGCGVMRAAKRRWPGLSNLQLIGICFLFTMAADVVVEGMFFMRLGFWHYAGGHFSVFGDQYFKYPLNEMIFAGCIFSFITCIRFFTNDKGETVVERGITELRASPRKKIALRFLAITAMSHFAIGVTYNLPQAFVGARSHEWPADVQKRSYLTNHICGAGTDRACPGNAVPLLRPGSAGMDPEGRLVVPAGSTVPEPIPFETP
jgi:hypothetical protein